MSGQYGYLIAKRDHVLSTARMSPQAKARAMGLRYEYVEPVEAVKKSCGDGESRPVGYDQSDPERPKKGAARTAGVATGPQDVIEAVSEAFGVSISDLVARSPAAHRIGRPRLAAALLMRYRLRMSYKQIATALGYGSEGAADSALVRARGLLGNDEEWTRRYRAADRGMRK